MFFFVFINFSISVEALAAEAEDDTSVGTVHYSVLSFQGLEKVLNITHTLFTKVSGNDQRRSMLKFMYRKSHGFWQYRFCGWEIIMFM